VTTFGLASGPPAGVLPGLVWEDTRQIIDPGDALLLYTDGIVEARRMVTLISNAENAAPQEYDLDGLCRFAATQYGATPKALLAAIQEDVRRFCAPEPPHDDCTMTALRYMPHGR
jgi:serine phosphatase RsbU (regulator of sigma subunit)